MGNIVKQPRETGIESLRILAAVGIVLSHYLIDGGISELQGERYVFFDALRTPVACAVDVFLIIMGYFSCTSQKRTLGKPLNLLVQMSFYGVIIYLLLTLLGYNTWSLKDFIWNAIPYSWFITLYLVVYFVSPYINMIITRLSSREWKWFLGFFLLFYSIWPMILGIIEALNRYFEAWSTIGRCGDFAGYHIITFVMMYCIGGCVRLNKLNEKVTVSHAVFALLTLYALDFGMRFMPLESTPWHVARWYSNIFVVSMAAYAFILFLKVKFKSNRVNSYATCAFTIYLIHTKLFPLVDTYATLRLPIHESIIQIGLFICAICIVSFLLFRIYNVLWGGYISKLDKFEIPYFDK